MNIKIPISSVLCLVVLLAFAVSVNAQQDTEAKKLAAKVAAAFDHRLKDLDKQHLLRGKLRLTIEDNEFEHRSFKSFTALDGWLKDQENDQGVPWREVGATPIKCSSGLCRLSLKENQMRHSHVFLTKVYYGRDKKGLYVKGLYIIYG